MSGMQIGFIMFGILMALLVVRIPIGIAMFMVGAGGYWYLIGDSMPLLNSLKNLAYARLSNYDLIVIPLFLLMGQFATHGGLSKALFRFVSSFLGHFKGGVAIAAIGACAGFGAICGSSLATAATMGQVTLPELKRYGYSGALSTGALAAGGTLGIMIPPSVPLVIYAILTQESIGKLFMAAVLPAGLVNSVVVGEAEVGQAMAEHPGIAKLVFTGSTRTGQDIMRRAAGNLKRLTLELGGNDAAIVLPGTDTAAIAEGLFATAFLNMGQTCAALKRLYVHESQVDAVCEQLAAIAARQVLGGGLEPGVTFGPVQNAPQLTRVEALVEDARAQGARIVCGGQRLDRPGYFYAPTIVAGLSNGTRLVDEEQFGPVLPVIAYRTVDEAVALANASSMGLGGSVWGDVQAATALAPRLECGTVWVNGHAEVLPHCPFGGSKMSGVGVEFGLDGLLEYTQPQLLNING